MRTFTEDNTFVLEKKQEEEGKTFSRTAWEMYIASIVDFISRLVLRYWCVKKLTIKVIVEGEYDEA